MKKIIMIVFDFILLALGFCALSIWVVGSHGHIQFRYYMLEDWVLTFAVIVGFGIPIYHLLKKIYKK
jgi:hypothetical protein